MRAVIDQSPAVAAWVANHIPGCERGWSNCKAIGVEDNGRLIGGTVFHNWAPEAGVIELSSAATSPRWAVRPMLKTIFGYAFDGLKCRMIVMRVGAENERMCSIARRLGCRVYQIDDLRGEGKDELIFTLTAAAWRRFIGGGHGETSIADAA